MTDGNAPPKCRTTGQWHLKPTAAGAGRQCRPYLLGELTKLLRYLGGAIGMGTGQYENELVCANPCDGCVVVRARLHAPGDLHQQFVANAVTERIIDISKFVDVQHQYGHWFPESHPDLASHSPASVIIPLAELDWAAIAERLRPFGERPIMVKDWVKSWGRKRERTVPKRSAT